VTEEAKATYTHIEENVYKDTGGFIDKEDSMPCLCKFDPGKKQFMKFKNQATRANMLRENNMSHLCFIITF